VAHDLDPEIQEELYGHMEDKLHAYLKGEEPLTEEDAFILVREHFGDPAVLKDLLQEVHAHAVHVTLARRIAAAVAATMGSIFAIYVVFSLVEMICAVWAGLKGAGQLPEVIPSLPGGARSLSYPSTLGLTFFISGSLGKPVLLWLILRRWQRQLEAGRRPWFLRWRTTAIVGGLALAMLLWKLVPIVRATDLRPGIPASSWIIRSQLHHVTHILQCLVWLWWCGTSPRKARTLVYGLCAWTAFYALNACGSPFPRVVLYLSTFPLDRVASSLGSARLAGGQVSGSSLGWHIALKPGHLWMPIQIFWLAPTAAVVAYLLHTLAQYVRRTHTPPPADLQDER
jgi:hypothetical protein